MAVPTWVAANAKMSIMVNGTFIPFKNAPDTMQRFVRPALFSTGHEVWELRTFGTALLCNYRELSLAVTTNHQIGDGKDKPLPGKFVVLASDGDRTLAVPPTTVRRPRIHEEEYRSLQDLCLFDFGERVRDRRIKALDLRSIKWSDDKGLSVDYSFLIGYPTASFDADMNDEGECQRFVNRWIRQDLQPDSPTGDGR
ncbi:MAG: hypothetical protein ACK4PN_16905 [Allorhizobium sp.]